ncbi:MAG: DUF481 domain-containing protein [Cytophagaceae bacterium]
MDNVNRSFVVFRVITIFVLFSVPTVLPAQILNIERFRFEKDTSNFWTGNVTFGLSSKKQNNTVTTVNAATNLVYLSEKHSYLNINNIRFLSVSNQNVVSEGYTHIRLNLYRRKKISAEPFIQFQYDIGRGLEKRELYGMSFRARIFASEPLTVAFSTGAMYEHEVWKGRVLRFPMEGSPGRAETHFLKSSSHLTLRSTLGKNVSLIGITYYQAPYEDFFRPRVITDISLMITLSRYFSFSNQFVSTFDAAPILDDNKFIYTLNTNLVVKF